MQNENKYIGDDKFKKFLEHYLCPTPLEVVKMKFAGAICSPNLDLRPTDVISSFWEEGQEPRLETKTEAELFFKFFMGLWDEVYHLVVFDQLKLSKKDYTLLPQALFDRYEEVEHGFLEGFWGGKTDLKIPSFVGQMADHLSELADLYLVLAKQFKKSDDILHAIHETDHMVEKGIKFIIEQYALPRIKNVQSETLQN